ncbi:hypothetical protein [Enterococcus faecalis]|uniref:hypothetical protein n=1 Tax=Enterococcus faecalis TaxID=1351 RepID=UPI003CC6B13D
MTLTSRQKKLLRCALFIFTLLLYIFPIFFKNPSLFFLLQLVWIITIHLLQQKLKLFNLTSPLKTWIILAFFYLTIIYQKRASVPFIDGTLALLIIWRFRE